MQVMFILIVPPHAHFKIDSTWESAMPQITNNNSIVPSSFLRNPSSVSLHRDQVAHWYAILESTRHAGLAWVTDSPD